jgi:site-specific recombinase XerD
VSLAVVRNLGAPSGLASERDVDDFEQEIVDQYALAMAAAGLSDGHIGAARAIVVEFARSLPGRVWTASVDDTDRFLAELRRQGQARSTVAGKAGGIARFYDFVITRYQGDIHRLTGWVVEQPIDEYNRPSNPVYGSPRVPPSEQEIEGLFSAWAAAVVGARKYLPAARDYFAASLWRRLGLRLNETVMLDIRDWRPDLGERGKLHVRHGKGSGGRGPKPRLLPAINSADTLIDWWLAEVRPRYGPDWEDPDAPMLPSERRDLDGRCVRVGGEALRSGLARATASWLPAWSDGRLTPHVLRHYCASSMYGRGVDLKAVQELLGHEWLSTTTRYVHVRSDHIERAWTDANQRVADRLGVGGR